MNVPELRPLQKAGVEFLQSHPKAYLCLRMRLGKTAAALQIAKPGLPTLVVAPVSVLYHWEAEVRRWRPDLTVEVLRKRTAKQGTADVTVVPYSNVTHLLKAGHLARPHYLIADEVHYCKSLQAQRTKAMMYLIKAAERFAGLTGTPIPNRPVELYPVLKAMGADFAKTKNGYGLRYCDGQYSPFHPGLDFTGASNLEELSEKLQDWMFYSTAAYVPPVTTVFETEASVSREERGLIGSIDWEAEEPSIPFEHLSLIRRLTGEQKFEAALEHILNCLEDRPKVVVFGWHTELLRRLSEELEAMGIPTSVLTGDMSHSRRQQAVEQFQNDPSVRVFIGNIQAAGEGISLAAADHCVFVEQAWTPGMMDQAAARIETADRDRIVTIDYLVRRGGIDSKLLAKIQQKRGITHSALKERTV